LIPLAMTELLLHGTPVGTVFDLLGHQENDMTFALGWGLAHNDRILRGLLASMAPEVPFEPPAVVRLQEYDPADRGFTDIQIVIANTHLVIEAKRGWDPPSAAQLRRYEARLGSDGKAAQLLAILTQNGTEQIVRHQLADWDPPSPIRPCVLGWSDVVALARRESHSGSLAQRKLAAELAMYLQGVADMRDTDSNSVFVVSLGTWSFGPAWKITAIQIVEDHSRYFFPASGKNWPKTPPNYVAFRYWGRLQSIHHVDDYTIAQDISPYLPGAPDTSEWEPHFLLTLGPAIHPQHDVPTGRGIQRSARVWVDIDLLLTCATITEALQATKSRRNE